MRGTVSANLYNVTVKEALDAILKANGCAWREKGNIIYVYTAKEMADIEKAERRMAVEVFRLYYTPAANAANMIKPMLSKEAEVSLTMPANTGIGGSGGSSGSSASSSSGGDDAGGDSHATEDMLIVKDYPEQIELVRKALKELDRRPQQILVEATIVAARLNEDNQLGVNFTILGGVDFDDIQGPAADSRNPAMTGRLENTQSGLGATDYEGVGTVFPQPTNGLKVGLVYNNFALFVNALEETTDTVVLANPKVLTLNKQRGEVLVGSEDGYLTTTVTESTAVQSVQFLETGTKLVFRPYVGDDGYIRMEVHPESSEGGVDARGLPSKQTTQVTTNVMVKDGHTVVIGGLFRERSVSGRSQVPLLGNMPLVGPLFRNQADSTVREEIIIMLTPHIVKDDKAYSDASEALLKDFEKLRVGVRRGMMPWGRERLAENCYEDAVREYAKPNPDTKKVLWHLDCATNLNPQFTEAINMKAQVTGKQVTSVDNASVRYFLKRRIMAERAATAPAARPAAVQALGQPSRQSVLATPPSSPATQPVAAAPSTQPVAERTDAASSTTAGKTFAEMLMSGLGDTRSMMSAAGGESGDAIPATQPASADGAIVVTESEPATGATEE